MIPISLANLTNYNSCWLDNNEHLKFFRSSFQKGLIFVMYFQVTYQLYHKVLVSFKHLFSWVPLGAQFTQSGKKSHKYPLLSRWLLTKLANPSPTLFQVKVALRRFNAPVHRCRVQRGMSSFLSFGKVREEQAARRFGPSMPSSLHLNWDQIWLGAWICLFEDDPYRRWNEINRGVEEEIAQVGLDSY